MISYSQQTGSGQATILNLILTEREKLRVWFDQYYAGQLSEQAMMQGVTSSNCLLLFVSAGVMKREFCIAEVRKAVALGKPILLVHEEDPRFNKDPDTHEFRSFYDMRDEAPEDLRYLFKEVESLAFRRRKFEQDSMVIELLTRMKNVSERR